MYGGGSAFSIASIAHRRAASLTVVGVLVERRFADSVLSGLEVGAVVLALLSLLEAFVIFDVLVLGEGALLLVLVEVAVEASEVSTPTEDVVGVGEVGRPTVHAHGLTARCRTCASSY